MWPPGVPTRGAPTNCVGLSQRLLRGETRDNSGREAPAPAANYPWPLVRKGGNDGARPLRRRIVGGIAR